MTYIIIISIVAILVLIIYFYLISKIKALNSKVSLLKEDLDKIPIILLGLCKRISFNEKDIARLETLVAESLTQDDLDDFCESLYTSIQSVGKKVKKQIKDEINPK